MFLLLGAVMIGLANNENTISSDQDGMRLIHEARLARMKDGPTSCSVEDAIDRTRRAGDAAANLARLIDGLYADAGTR